MHSGLDFDDLRTRIPWFVGIGAALLMFMPVVNIVAVMVGGGDELSYDTGIAMTSCGIQGAPCWTVVELQVGNTGSVPQDLIEIDLETFPDWSTMGRRVVKIVGSTAELQTPKITIESARKHIRIEHLDANQMIEFELLVVGLDARENLEQAEPVIQASGRVIRSNPKATALARAFRTAFAFLI